MKRRGFLARLLGVPVAAALPKVPAQPRVSIQHVVVKSADPDRWIRELDEKIGRRNLAADGAA